MDTIKRADLTEITHAVLMQCKRGPSRRWEPMAAFNVLEVAEDYARQCRVSPGGYLFRYRVVKIVK